MSETWTSLKLIQWTAGYFEKKEIPNPRLDAELLLAHVLGCRRIDLYTGHEKTIPEKKLADFKSLIERRVKLEPLQYIVGETEFWGLKIRVTPDVLIPRPETELLVEEALKTSPPAPLLHDAGEGCRRRGEEIYILDIGTGSGCIAIALVKNLPDAKVTATDISKEALAIAQQNAEANGIADRIEFILSDIAPWKTFQAAGRVFDLIVSNPPYIPTNEFPDLQPEVRDFEPRRALDGGSDGMDVIKSILTEAPSFLRRGGRLLLEIGDGAAVKKEMNLKIRKDYAGKDRIAIFEKIP